MPLARIAQVWLDYASWHAENGRREAAAKVYKRAMQALPDCLILHFAFADFAETGGNLTEVRPSTSTSVHRAACPPTL